NDVISLVRFTLECSAIVWYLYHQKDNIEKVQRQAARFIDGDYTTKLILKDLKLPSQRDRRKANLLVFFNKKVEGLVPALPSHFYLNHARQNKPR
ncbi:hypothetical protein MAR_028626, partial [Mya arenaria]